MTDEAEMDALLAEHDDLVERFAAGDVRALGELLEVASGTIGGWPNDHAPLQNVPLTSSEAGVHVLDESCWCLPNVLAQGQGEEFRILEVNHRGQLAPGDRVAVDDPALAELAEIFRAASGGEEPPANNEGTVESVHGDQVLIDFDDGGSAPYPLADVRRIE